MNTIHELVRNRRSELGMSLREVEARAKAAGFRLTQGAVNQYERGLSKPRADKVDGLAAALKLSKTAVQKAIAATPDVDWEQNLPEYQDLNEENRQAIRSLAKALLIAQTNNEELTTRLHDLETSHKEMVDEFERYESEYIEEETA